MGNDERRQQLVVLRERMTGDSEFRSWLFSEPEAALKSIGFDDATASQMTERVAQARLHAEWGTAMNRARETFDAEGKDGIASYTTEELLKLGAVAAWLGEVTRPRTDKVLRTWGGEPEEWHDRFGGLRQINAGWAGAAAEALERRQIPSSKAEDRAKAVQAMRTIGQGESA